jgi:4-hydroxy-tetrahydrodipicolinate reductase
MSVRLNLWLVGAQGRMGRAIEGLLESEEGFRLSGRIVSRGPDRAVSETGDPVVVVDFSSPEGLMQAIAFAEEHGYPLVSGTTGLSDVHHARLLAASALIPVLHSANMSAGVQTLLALAEMATGALPGWDAEVVELHHRAKKDAPSGTALALAQALAPGPDGPMPLRTAREGMVGARPDQEIGVMAVRGGDVVGEHTLYLFGAGERLELTHRATDRTIFARGAIRAACWLADRPPGRYTMRQVLGLERAAG